MTATVSQIDFGFAAQSATLLGKPNASPGVGRSEQSCSFPGPILPYRPSKNNAEKEIAFPEEINMQEELEMITRAAREVYEAHFPGEGGL